MSATRTGRSEFEQVRAALASPLAWAALPPVLWLVLGRTGALLGLALGIWHVVRAPRPTTLQLTGLVLLGLVPGAWFLAGVPDATSVSPLLVGSRGLAADLAAIGVVFLATGTVRAVVGRPARAVAPATSPGRASAPPATPQDREAFVDVAKAVGIVVVVLIHALRPRWDPGVSGTELWLGDVTRFAVPAFLAASGYLYARASPTSRATTVARLRRVLVPYLVASVIAEATMPLFPPELGSRGLFWDLLLGNAFGPYYYVFVITGLIVAVPFLERLTPTWRGRLFRVLLVAQLALEIGVLRVDPFWLVRSPMFWWPYFLAGWWLWERRGQVLDAVRPRRGRLLAAASVAWLAVVAGLVVLPAQTAWRLGLAWAGVWVLLALVTLATVGRTTRSPVVRWLSDASYAIYLFHLFGLQIVRAAMPMPPGAADAASIVTAWAVGIAGALLVVGAARSVHPQRAREIVGA